MGHTKNYKPTDVVGDLTKPLSKIWDNLMPTSYPNILEFKTNRATEVDTTKRVGPFSIVEKFVDYDCDVTIDNKPLLKIGWDGGEITQEMVNKAYGENYFHELRGTLVNLSKYAGLKYSHFDFGGELHISVDDPE